MSEQTDISQKVPREAVINVFGSLLALNPVLYRRRLDRMASQYGVGVEDLATYVTEVLKILPPYED